jgi:UPF0716 protein FxsA
MVELRNMLSMKALMRFLDRGFLMRMLLLVMLYSLVPFGECYLLLVLGEYLSTYLLLALVAGTALLGMLGMIRPVAGALQAVHTSIDEGYYPEEPFALLAGTLMAGVLLVTPGFVTDALGMLMFVPFVRRAVGGIITSRMRSRLKELYEYIKLYER